MMREYGFTADNVYERAMKLLDWKHLGPHQTTVEVWRNEGGPN